MPETPQPRRDAAFHALFALAVMAFVVLLWVSPLPPLTDFGGHLQMIHAWAHADEPGWQELVVRRDAWWLPNVLVARLAVALHHAGLGELVALKLLLSLAVIATAYGLLRLARVLGRSPWQVFLALPLFWSGIFVLGLVNYLAALAVLPWALALALELARRPVEGLAGRRAFAWRLALLGGLGALAFFLHTFGALVVAGSVGLVVLIAAPPRRVLLLLPGVAPALALFVHWLLRVRSSMEELRTLEFAPLGEKLEAFVREFDVTSGALDSTTASLALLVAGALALLPRVGRKRAEGAPARATTRERWALPGLVLGLLVAYLVVLPTYVGDVFTGARVIAPTAWLAVLLPNPDWAAGRRLGRALLGLGVVTAFTAGAGATWASYRFGATELAPLEGLLERVPEGSHTQCVGVRVTVGFPRRSPLDHNCNGLLTARRGAFAGGGFADTDYNAVELRRKRPRPSDLDWYLPRGMSGLDFLIVRARATTPEPDRRLARKVAEVPIAESVEGDAGGVPRWVLYEVLAPPTRSDALVPPPERGRGLVGGPGGLDFRWDCAAGLRLDRLELGLVTRPPVLSGLKLGCRATRPEQASPEPSPELGTLGKTRKVLRCGPRERPVGLIGRAADFVDAVGLMCRGERELEQELEGLDLLGLLGGAVGRGPVRGAVEGGPGGVPYELRCPAGHELVGVRGRAGALLDAIGVVCAPVTARPALEPGTPRGRL